MGDMLSKENLKKVALVVFIFAMFVWGLDSIAQRKAAKLEYKVDYVNIVDRAGNEEDCEYFGGDWDEREEGFADCKNDCEDGRNKTDEDVEECINEKCHECNR